MFECKFIKTFPREIIAVDEVGRGPLGGPVVIGGVRIRVESEAELRSLSRSLRSRGVQDSKKLTAEDRHTLLEKFSIEKIPHQMKGQISIKDWKISFVTWEMCHETIDRENILAASLRGMKEAALFLSESEKQETTLFIDGNQKLRWGNESSPWEEITVIEGDSKSALIGLASIIAKEKRDAFMREMHELYPHYGFNTNAGYGTAEHRKAIQKFGPCPIHRKTFGGVKEFIGTQ
jgi:ribonuclease HII